VAIHNPDALRAPKVLTQTLARWLGRSATTVRDWVARGILPQPEKLGPKTFLYDVAAVLRFLSQRMPWGEAGYVERKAATAARRAALNGVPVAMPAAVGGPPPDDQADDQADDQKGGGDGA
jgi:hypothetical protein